MKKHFILLLCISFWGMSFGQKKEVYLNDDLIEITKEEYDKKLDELTYNFRFDMDSIVANVKVLRVKKGYISKEVLAQIKNTLSNTTKTILPSSTTIVINYFIGRDNCNTGPPSSTLLNIYYKYSKRIKKYENVNQFFIYKSEEGVERYGEKLIWYPDVNQLIENTFFPIHYYCGNYVIIKADGSFYATKGEYNIEEIIDVLNKK